LDGESEVDDCAEEPDSEMDVISGEEVISGDDMTHRSLGIYHWGS